MAMKFDPGKCTGCRLCALACSGIRIGVFSDTHANIAIDSRYRKDSFEVRARLCDRCGACIEACPTGAISDVGGALVVARDQCTSCGLCASTCPQGVIYMWNDAPVLCNLCGGEPWCVKFCPRDAISFEEVQS